VNARSIPARRWARIRDLSTALVAALLVLAPVAAPAMAAEGDPVTWTVRTASNEYGSERTNYSYTIDPGGTIYDSVVVANHGADPVELRVYAADGSTSEDGQLSLLVAGEESHGVGAWITTENPSVTVAAGETATVPFTVAVPAEATPGDYAGGVVTSLTVPDATQGVNVDRRLGIRVNLRVGGEIAPALAVENMSVSWGGGLNPFAGGDATVSYTLHNSGNAAISAQPATHVTGPFGMFGMDAPAVDAVPELLPGESWTQTVTLAGVPPLFALLASTTVTPLVLDASGSTSPITEVSGSAAGPAIPWILLVIVLLVAAGVSFLLRTRGTRKKAAEKRREAEVEEAVAKALEQERTKAGATAE
jgi:hypothetical protein